MPKFVEHLEGSTRLLVPPASLNQDPPPTSPVFFNPEASLNRDVSVALATASRGSTFCDSMCGVGARGVRVANEATNMEAVTLVDFNRVALGLARKAAATNRVARKCRFSDSETSTFLALRHGKDERFDCVDVDPFGTPVHLLWAALGATADGGILSVTATDTAVLCGVYPRVSVRRYGASPVNNSFRHETGIRILAGALVRTGAQLDLGVVPVFAHATRHYMRVFARVKVGASRAERSLDRIGHISSCPVCGHVESSGRGSGACQKCERRAKVAGPAWIGGLTDARLLEGGRDAALRLNLASAADLMASFDGVDSFPPWSFSVDSVSSALRVATLPESSVREALAGRGWRAMRTPFEKAGMKTDAPYDEFLEAARGLARRAGGRPRSKGGSEAGMETVL